MMKTTIQIGLMSVLLFGCATQKEVVENDENQWVLLPVMPIGGGELYGAGEEGIEESQWVFRTVEDWEAFKVKLDAVNTVSDDFKESRLNFDEHMVVACVDQVRGTGGHTLEILDVIETPDEIIVQWLRTSPEEMATSVLTQPFQIVRIPISTKTVVFEEQE